MEAAAAYEILVTAHRVTWRYNLNHPKSISSLLWKPQFLYSANMVIAINFKSILNMKHVLNFMHCQTKYKHEECDNNIDNKDVSRDMFPLSIALLIQCN
jgi:hypothetical protein